MSAARHDPPMLAATPQLEHLLARLARRLSAQIWMHGLGLTLFAVAAWLVFAFLADWGLHVPRGVRWVHLLIVVALPLVLLARELVRHLRRRPDRVGLALLIERAHPELEQLFVSAVQFQERPVSAAPQLVTRVLRDAELRAARTGLERVLDVRAPALRCAAGVALALLVVAASLLQRDHAAIFYARLLGADVPWPQRTHLTLEIAGDSARVREVAGGLEVRLARGGDLPLIVHARGLRPDEVLLHFSGGGEVALGSSTDGTFRTLLRACQEDLTFHATGGDDNDADPTVTLLVLDPPDLSALALTLEPPAYTGLAAHVEFDRDVEVIGGTRIAIAILPQPADAHGRVRLLPADTTLELAPRPFPARPADAGQPGLGLGFELVAERSLRYRFELVDSSGLANPDPGLFAIDVVTDQRPQVELLAPARTDIETVARGALRLLARVSDDFGVASLRWRAHAAAQAEAPAEWNELELTAAPPPSRGDEVTRGSAHVGGARVDIAALAPAGSSVALGDLFELELQALDNRPALADGTSDPAGVGTTPALRVRIVSDDEFLRRLQDRLAKVRMQVSELDELQRQRSARVDELLAALESDQLGANASELAAALTGQRRVLGDAEALTREFASVLEGVLYARLDEQAAPLFEALDTALASATTKGFPLAAWRSLMASVDADRAASQGTAGQLAGLLRLALAISSEDCAQAVDALDRATRGLELEQVHAELSRARQHQVTARAHLADLLDRLAEWDNFQSVLALTRDILNRQKTLLDTIKDKTHPDQGK